MLEHMPEGPFPLRQNTVSLYVHIKVVSHSIFNGHFHTSLLWITLLGTHPNYLSKSLLSILWSIHPEFNSLLQFQCVCQSVCVVNLVTNAILLTARAVKKWLHHTQILPSRMDQWYYNDSGFVMWYESLTQSSIWFPLLLHFLLLFPFFLFHLTLCFFLCCLLSFSPSQFLHSSLLLLLFSFSCPLGLSLGMRLQEDSYQMLTSLSMDFPFSRTARTKFLFLIHCPVSSIIL